jgi:hypothetical protein
LVTVAGLVNVVAQRLSAHHVAPEIDVGLIGKETDEN